MTIGENVKRLRESAGLTQRELAGLVYVSHGMIAQVEQGIKNPSVALCEQIAAALGCKRDDILCTGK